MVNVKKMLTKTLMIFRVKDQLISLSSRINSIIYPVRGDMGQLMEEGILIIPPISQKQAWSVAKCLFLARAPICMTMHSSRRLEGFCLMI